LFVLFAAWFLLTLLPSGAIMMGQRLAYLPSAGFCLLLAAVLFDRDPHAVIGSAMPGNRGAGIVLRRVALPALLGIYALATMAQATLLRALSEESFRQTRTMVELGRGDPRPQRIFVMNGWVPSSFWISQATRWLSQGQAPPITVLTLSPELFPSAFRDRHPVSARLIDWLAQPVSSGGTLQVVPADSAAIILRTTEEKGAGLFGSPFLQFFLFGRRGFTAGETVRTEVLTAEILDGGGRGAGGIRFSFPRPLSDPGGVWVFQDSLRIRVVDPTRAVPDGGRSSAR